MILWLYGRGGSLSICLFGESELHLFQADAVQNQEMLQKAYEAANRVQVIFAQLGPLLCFGTIDNCPKTIFISLLILSNAASFLAASLKMKKTANINDRGKPRRTLKSHMLKSGLKYSSD